MGQAHIKRRWISKFFAKKMFQPRVRSRVTIISARTKARLRDINVSISICMCNHIYLFRTIIYSRNILPLVPNTCLLHIHVYDISRYELRERKKGLATKLLNDFNINLVFASVKHR